MKLKTMIPFLSHSGEGTLDAEVVADPTAEEEHLMRAAELVVRCLEHEGVHHVFGVPGEETMALLNALADSQQVRFVPTRHEQGAAFMADVWGRLTGTAGVCLGTLGPGATNLLTGVADAYLDHAPLVALTGQAGLERVHKESHQYLDVVGMFRPVTKWSARIERAEVVPEVARKAFRLATAEKAGPTHLELPEDVADEEVPPGSEHPLPIRVPRPTVPSGEAIEAALALLRQARRPVILVGNGVIRAHAAGDLAALARRLHIPVVHTFMGKGILSDADPLSWGAMGLQARDIVMDGIDGADLVLAVGYDLVEYAPSAWNHVRERPIVHVDALPAEVDQSYLPAVELVGDVGASLRALALAWQGRRGVTARPELREQILAELNNFRADEGFPIKPQRILADLRAALDPKDIVISDVGAHKLWVARLFPTQWANTVVISNGLASMGIGVPGAVAAKLAHPERRVVAVTGDGGFLMNSQELETAKRLGTAFVVLIWVDDAYGVIEWKQQQRFGRTFGTHFTNPDFVRYAEAFNLPGFRVESAAELLPTLRRALDQDVPSIVEVPVDYRENIRLSTHLATAAEA
jgi:acetolactate synthase-1/2/3 large subunit